MDNSDLMGRLNRIKAAQHYDYKYVSKEEKRSPGNELHDVAMETKDIMKEGQQVTPGPSTLDNLETYRGTEGARLTPHSPTSDGSPQNDSDNFPFKSTGAKTSTISTPTLLSEKFLIKSPHTKNKTDIVTFSLDSPVISSIEHFSSEGHSSQRDQDKQGLGHRGQISASSSEHHWNNVHSPISSSLTYGKLLGLTSHSAALKDFTQSSDRRLSDSDFFNESIDTSFLVQNTPDHNRPSEDLQKSYRSFDRHNTHSHDNSPLATVTSRTITMSPAIGQLIDF
jgi:hypothetical protein